MLPTIVILLGNGIYEIEKKKKTEILEEYLGDCQVFQVGVNLLSFSA